MYDTADPLCYQSYLTVIHFTSKQFGYSRTNLELELYWSHFLKPGVNRKPWTAAENKKLKVRCLSFSFWS